MHISEAQDGMTSDESNLEPEVSIHYALPSGADGDPEHTGASPSQSVDMIFCNNENTSPGIRDDPLREEDLRIFS